jgi:hypothetical protein
MLDVMTSYDLASMWSSEQASCRPDHVSRPAKLKVWRKAVHRTAGTFIEEPFAAVEPTN